VRVKNSFKKLNPAGFSGFIAFTVGFGVKISRVCQVNIELENDQ